MTFIISFQIFLQASTRSNLMPKLIGKGLKGELLSQDSYEEFEFDTPTAKTPTTSRKLTFSYSRDPVSLAAEILPENKIPSPLRYGSKFSS